MKFEVVPVKNVARLLEAAESLTNRVRGLPGMGIVDGDTGLGKSIATTFLITRKRGIYVRTISTTSPTSLLGAILKELDVDMKGSCAQMVDEICKRLADDPRPIFIDEADKLIAVKRLIETTRDIHDLSDAPVILIGEAHFRRKVRAIPRIAGRVLEAVEFQPLDNDDARLIAKRLCDVTVRADLVDKINAAAKGSTRYVVTGLAKAEKMARVRGLDSIGMSDWPAGESFFAVDLRGN